MLEELLKQMAGEFPLLSKIFVEERDLYMTNALHTLLKKSTFDKRVAWSKTDGKRPLWFVEIIFTEYQILNVVHIDIIHQLLFFDFIKNHASLPADVWS